MLHHRVMRQMNYNQGALCQAVWVLSSIIEYCIASDNKPASLPIFIPTRNHHASTQVLYECNIFAPLVTVTLMAFYTLRSGSSIVGRFTAKDARCSLHSVIIICDCRRSSDTLFNCLNFMSLSASGRAILGYRRICLPLDMDPGRREALRAAQVSRNCC